MHDESALAHPTDSSEILLCASACCAGDVAFTKHSTPLEVARDGSAAEPWATKDKVRVLSKTKQTCLEGWHPHFRMLLVAGGASGLRLRVAVLSSDPCLSCLPTQIPLQGDLRLLCPSGGCATVDQYERCNIAKSPARAGACLCFKLPVLPTRQCSFACLQLWP